MSYFDPYKYYEFWEKTKLQNYELHSSSRSFNQSSSSTSSTSSSSSSSSIPKKSYQSEKSHTDDFLNMKSNIQKDLNNNNNGYINNNNKAYQKQVRRQEIPNGYNNIESSHNYRKPQFNSQQQQNFTQGLYQQETHLKRYQSAKIYNSYNN